MKNSKIQLPKNFRLESELKTAIDKARKRLLDEAGIDWDFSEFTRKAWKLLAQQINSASKLGLVIE